MASYTIVFNNFSSNSWNFCCFQKPVDIQTPGVMSLAWFAKKCDSGTSCSFNWSIDYSFVWAQTGPLVPGVTFNASQVVRADLNNNNVISLDYDGAFHFTDPKSATPFGSLYIDQTANVPPQTASVGIGMSGAGTFAVQAQPNISLTFTPHPKYYVAFGDFIPGEVLDEQEMTGGAEVVFPPNVPVMYATLQGDNTWSITQIPPAHPARRKIAARELLVD